MKAAAIDRFGPPSAIKLHTLPVPKPGPSEVLIALHGAGVGYWDASIRTGSWRPAGRPRFPLILGIDGAGTVVARGKKVRRFQYGDRVWAYEYDRPQGGFYAEYVLVKERHLGRVPRHLDLVEAGAGAVTALTAYQGIRDALRLKRGETILIYGATGTVGTLAIQFARSLGARVIATASGARATRLVRKLGAHAVFDSREAGAHDKLARLAPDGLDAALVLANGRSLEPCLDLVRPGGRVAFPYGVEPKPRSRRRVRMKPYDAITAPRQFTQLGKAASAARLRVPIFAKYPLAQAARAHMRLAKHGILGRMVLTIRSR